MKSFFLITATESSKNEVLVFSIKEKDRREAEGRVVSYLHRNLPPSNVYSIQTRYVIPDIDGVHLLEIR